MPKNAGKNFSVGTSIQKIDLQKMFPGCLRLELKANEKIFICMDDDVTAVREAQDTDAATAHSVNAANSNLVTYTGTGIVETQYRNGEVLEVRATGGTHKGFARVQNHSTTDTVVLEKVTGFTPADDDVLVLESDSMLASGDKIVLDPTVNGVIYVSSGESTPGANNLRALNVLGNGIHTMETLVLNTKAI